MIKSIIIEDEPNNREILQRDLAKHCPEVEIIAICEHPIEGLKAIRALKPQLVFLDIELPKMNAFDMLDCLERIEFDIIFTTAYDQYILNALRLSAVDYLQKPIAPQELKSAVQKAVARNSQRMSAEQMTVLKNNWQGKQQDQRIAIPSINKIEFILVQDIIYCSADGSITRLALDNAQSSIAASKNLGKFEETLPTDQFFRIHHKHLINISHLLEFHPGNSYVVMKNGQKLPVSQSKRKEFGEVVKGMSI